MTTAFVWIPAALLAGLFQAWRTALQQSLRTELTVAAAGLVRYFYGAPVAVALLAGYSALRGLGDPKIDPQFLAFAVLAALAQILATNLLIMAFGYRNFVVGTAFAKTEAVQAAFFSWIVFGEHLSVLVWVGICVGVGGVLTLGLGGRVRGLRDAAAGLAQPAALCGLGAGALFALTGVLVKRATEQLGTADPIAAALCTLVVVVVLQALMQGVWLAVFEPTSWPRVIATWPTSGQVGLLAAMGSACWFAGFALAPVALVRIVGQIEVVFTLGFGRLYLRERAKAHEIVGLLLVAAGVAFALAGSR